MRGFALVVLFVVGGVGTASAEKAKAKESAKIYNRAGEQGQVVIKVKEGQVMRIDRKEGRWYKVRVSGRTGWIPRSKVELIQEDEMVRNTRRRPFVDGRGTKRGFGGESAPDDRVGEDATTSNDDDDKKPSGKKPGKDADDDEEPDEDDEKPSGKKPAGKKPEVKKPEAKKPEVKKPEAKKPDPDEDGDTDGEEPKAKPGDKDDDSGDEVKDDRPKLHVKKKTVVLSEASPDSEESFTAKPETVLHKTGNTKGKYVEVETEDGDLGFVLASSLESGGGGDDDDGGPSGPKVPAQIDARARVGVTLIKQGVRTVGGVAAAQPDNYDLSTSAATVALGGSYLRPQGKSGYIGGELAFGIAKAIPGIKVDANNTTGITIYDMNLRAMYGHDFKKKSGMMAFARLGFRYYSYQVADVGNLMKNTAKLPSEIVKAPTIGGALTLPRLTDKIGLRFSLDAVVFGASMEQTKGLEDGVDASMKGVDLGIGFTYRWKPNMDINAAYDLNYGKYSFGAPMATSMRGHMGTDVSRTDIFHAVTVGIAKAF